MKPCILAAAALACVTFASPTLAMNQPPKPKHSAVDAKHCTFEWKTGAGIGVWTERCALDTGLWDVAFKPEQNAFILTVDGGDPQTVLQVFDKPAKAPVDAILPELIRQKYVLATECVFAPADTSYIPKPPKGQKFYEVVPIGKRKADFDKLPNDEVPDPPCGDYGTAPDGIQYFMVDTAHPDKVIYVNLGQDGTMFDPKTITVGE